MRAFDDICVQPNFQDDEQPSQTSKTVIAAVVCGVAAFAGYSIYLGRLPDLHGLDACFFSLLSTLGRDTDMRLTVSLSD